jgi:alkylation response protein AidB-like acyl-CoA dehydrogenase
VWAAERPGGALRARDAGGGRGGWVISGTKPYASGAGALDHALVTAVTAEGPRLFDVDLRRASSDGCGDVSAVPDSWPAVGMAESLSAAVRFREVRVEEAATVGPPGFYTDRPGFWAGAAGVAACWYGGADGVLRALTATLRPADPAGAAPGPHLLAHLGAAAVRCRSLAAALTAAAAEIDRDPDDRTGSARLRALSLRHLVYEGCGEVLDRASRAGRTSLLTSDRAAARRLADLPVYLSQHHPDDALVAIGLDVLEGPPGPDPRGHRR